MARRRKYSVSPAELANIKKFATEQTEVTKQIMDKIGLFSDMTPLTVVTTTREYLERQSNQERTCNNILYKFGVNAQFNGQTRKARVYALTTIDEAMTNGLCFDPKTVPAIAEKRYNKIVAALGRDVESSVDNNSSMNDNIKVKSKKQVAVDIYKSNSDKSTADLVKLIMDKLKIEKSNAYSVLSAAKKSLTV